MRTEDLYRLPPDLPVPVNDGACNHLPGLPVAAVPLPSTAGRLVRLDEATAPRTVVFCYPRTGAPDKDPPGGLAAWNAIPGARGCTPQACAYRDSFREFQERGVRVFGLSTQSTVDQQELVQRLHLPYEVLSDAELHFTRAMRLPTFEVEGITMLKRFTLVLNGGQVEHCFYPVFPSDQDARQVLDWLIQVAHLRRPAIDHP